MEIDEIEYEIAQNRMDAPQVFTQMRQHVRPEWKPIDSAPKDRKCFFWVVPADTEDPPILHGTKPRRVEGMFGCCWSSVQTATHWMPLPEPPKEDMDFFRGSKWDEDITKAFGNRPKYEINKIHPMT